MEYRQHQLDNGLTIVAECNPRAYVAAFGYFVRTGARDETPEIGGVSHFLEHMVFKGTPNHSAEDVNRRLDEMGSSSNARTGEEATIYHAAVLPEFQTEMVDLLSDLMRPSLRVEDFETEKKVIIEEILMYQDQPPYGGHEQIMQSFFGEHPLGKSVLGTVDTVSDLSADQMNDYFKRRYSPGNMALAVAGAVDFDQLVADVERNCGNWESFAADRSPVPTDNQAGFSCLHKPTSSQQYILQLAAGPSSRDEDRYAARVASTILGDDSGSRMFWKFLDPGYAESAGIGAYEYFDNGVIMSFICCSPEEAQANLERLAELQKEAQREGVTQRELDLAKSKIASQIILASERTESRMFSAGSQWLIDQPFKTVGEIAEAYDRISLDQVNHALQKYPLANNTTLVVGPNDSLTSPY